MASGSADPDDTGSLNRGVSGSSTLQFVCQECGRIFDKLRGLSQHRRKAHPDTYGAAPDMPVARRKARWDREESVLMAREELRLLRLGVKNVNQELVKSVPGRTLEAIKGQRRSSAYREILDSITESETLAARGSSSAPLTPLASGQSAETQQSPPLFSDDAFSDGDEVVQSVPPLAREDLLNDVASNRSCLCLSDCDFQQFQSDVLAGKSGSALQSVVDSEYTLWHESMFKPAGDTGRRNRGPRAKARPCARGGTGVEPVNSVAGEAPGSQEEGVLVAKKYRRPSRIKRRATYAKVQSEYGLNRQRCAKTVLSGDWEKEPPVVPIREQEAFWRPLMETPSKSDNRTPATKFPVSESVARPVTVSEVESTLKGLKDGAPGPDHIGRTQLRSVDKHSLAAHMSFWMCSGCPPSRFKEGITTLVPKSADSKTPGEYRPITVATIIARLFHRLLAQRLERAVPLSPRQKAFRRGDGLADNVWLLRSTLQDRTRSRKPVFVTFIDVAKAFDSVSHESMLIAAKRVGVPDTLLTYIGELYSGTVTRLKVGKSLSDRITVLRGVRQGDPLSPLLFNYVMDWVLDELDPQLGVTLQEGACLRLNHLAFADDVSLVSESRRGALRLAEQFEHGLGEVGLLPNAKKSATLAVVVDGKRKRWYVDRKPFLWLNGRQVCCLGVTDVYKYLGTSSGVRVAPPDVKSRLEKGIEHLTRAPLKPQQRIFLLRVHLLPSLYHQLVLDRVTVVTMNWLDRIVRKAVRGWLRLPHDSPKSMFHASVADGGLGIPLLGTKMRILKGDRIRNLFRRATIGADPVLEWYVANSVTLQKEYEKWNKVEYRGAVVSNTKQVDAKLANELHITQDGSGLSQHHLVPKIHSWVNDGTQLQTGKMYIGSVQIRSNSLYTEGRASRGRPLRNPKCTMCGDYESLGHILQNCARTWAVRNQRHNYLVDKVTHKLKQSGYEVHTEPRIPTPAGIRKPDIVAILTGCSAVVFDATIVSDNANLSKVHVLKQQHYDTSAVREWVASKAQCEPSQVEFSSISFNWRGALARESAADLLTCGFTVPDLRLLSVVVLEKGFEIYLFSRKRT